MAADGSYGTRAISDTLVEYEKLEKKANEITITEKKCFNQQPFKYLSNLRIVSYTCAKAQEVDRQWKGQTSPGVLIALVSSLSR